MRFNLTFFWGIDIFDGHGTVEDIHAPDFISMLQKVLLRPEGAEPSESELIKSALALKSEVGRLCLSRWPERLDRISPKMWKYEAVFLYAKEHGDASLNVARLADIFGVRQDVFSRSFSRDVGIAPKQYIADVLLRKISAYLLTSKLSMKEIAHQLKFSSEYYMSRFFKKHTSLSPTDFKKQVLGKQ
ncbi:MAG: helix-turn-helix transcriptional regulator [Planctomycetes bacterium]|nr:helix-turn-helix transcriptional regulator [Planctomycetota bacterium]